MKKLTAFALSLMMISSAAFAGSNDIPAKSDFVVKQKGAGLFQVIYLNESATKVKLTILNDRNQVVYSETIKKPGKFCRPYNLSSLGEGEYTIEIADDNGKQAEKFTYGKASAAAKHVNVIKLKDSNKFMLTLAGIKGEMVNIKIYDGASKLVYNKAESVNGDFAKLFNLASIEGEYTFEVTDASGVARSVSR